MYYYGMQGAMERTGYNFGISMLISGIYEVIGNCVSIFFINKIGRRKGLLLCSLGLVICGLSFALEFVKQHDSVQSFIISISTFCNILVFAYQAIIQMEIFPTEMLTIVIGITKAGNVLCLLQPFIVNWVNSLSLHPAIFCGILYLTLGIFPIFLYSDREYCQEVKVEYQEL